MAYSVMPSVIYAECHKNPFKLSVISLNVIKLSVILLNVIKLSVILLNVIAPNSNDLMHAMHAVHV